MTGYERGTLKGLRLAILGMLLVSLTILAGERPRLQITQPSPLQRLNDQIRAQQQQAHEELVERSQVRPQQPVPARTELPMERQAQTRRCQRQQLEIQQGGRPQVSGDCRIWQREQFRPPVTVEP